MCFINARVSYQRPSLYQSPYPRAVLVQLVDVSAAYPHPAPQHLHPEWFGGHVELAFLQQPLVICLAFENLRTPKQITISKLQPIHAASSRQPRVCEMCVLGVCMVCALCVVLSVGV